MGPKSPLFLWEAPAIENLPRRQRSCQRHRLERSLENPKSKIDGERQLVDPRGFGLIKVAYTVKATLELLSIGRTSLYAAVKQGELHPVKFGRKTLFYAARIWPPSSKAAQDPGGFIGRRARGPSVKPEEPPPSPVPSAGYLGLTERSIDVDWKSVREHGPSVIVPPFSPAWRSGLRSGDFIKSINGHSYDDFHARQYRSSARGSRSSRGAPALANSRQEENFVRLQNSGLLHPRLVSLPHPVVDP